MNCPCCNKKISQKVLNTPYLCGSRFFHNVHECSHCSAIFTSSAMYKGDSYEVVLPIWDTAEDVTNTSIRYFDLEVLGSQATLERRHGWFNETNRKIVQTG